MSGLSEATQILQTGNGEGGAQQGTPTENRASFTDMSKALGGNPAPLGSVVFQDVHVSSGFLSEKKIPIMVGSAVVVLACLFLIGMQGDSSFEKYLALLGLSSTGEEYAVPPPKKMKKIAVEAPKVEETLSTEASKEQTIWSKVQNDWNEGPPEGEGFVSSDELSVAKEGMDHKFPYQRYKSVLDLGGLKKRGSEEVLRQAFDSKNGFWMRMRALIALANIGDEITTEDVQIALGNAHSELRARFFKRFEKSPCDKGCFYIARASMPYLDALGREQVIRVIARENGPQRDRFLVAAMFDPSENVRLAAQEWLDRNYVDQGIWDEMKSLSEAL